MAMLPSTYASEAVEQEARAFWHARALPPAAGFLGAPTGPTVRQLLGTYTPGDSVTAVVQRAVVADVDARYLALTGRRVLGTLRREGWTDLTTPDPVAASLERLAVWVGGEGGRMWAGSDRTKGVERIVGRLARRGIVVARDLPLRLCPSCSAPRSPERIIYQEEEGDTELVRFRVPLDNGIVANAVVWVDAPWRLLATSAILVNPDLPYVVARYRRRKTEDVVLTSRSSLERFAEWMPGATFEVIAERPGREFAGRRYVYPLAHEFPMGGDLPPPSGTIVAVSDVTDTGTGIVPLVPGHGALDATIADANGVAGWPVVTSSGTLDTSLKHKYAGLDLKTATEFVVRDLEEAGSVFAQLRVRRGVPHCALCTTALVWSPGRAWCLEPGRLSTELDETYHRLLPHAPPLPHVEVAPWPVSESRESDEPSAVAVLECPQCERLDELDGPPTCSCGSTRFPVRRRLVPSASGSFSAWATLDPVPSAGLVRLYLNERRAVPTVIHHVTALSAVDGSPADFGATVLPTVPEVDLADLAATHGADAVRAALMGSSAPGRVHGPIVERCLQERRRLGRLWGRVAELLDRLDPVTLAALSPPITGFLSELEPEDRALLARFERTRIHALADYDRWAAAAAYRRVFRFLETDLAEYADWVQPRLELGGAPATKRAALRTLVRVLAASVTLLGPVVPHAADRLYRALVPDRASLFEGRLTGVETALLSDDLASAWDRWRSVVEATRRFRAAGAGASATTVAGVALVVADDALGEKLRREAPVIERLAGIVRLEVGSPTRPWLGRERRLRPNESEIQRIFGSQASQISHLLRRIPPRRNGVRSEPTELSVVIEGIRHYVQPSMVTYSDTLPEGMAPTPWPLGEMYVRREEAEGPTPAALPPLTPDAYWLVRRLARRLQRGGPVATTGRVAIVATSDPLAAELRSVAAPVAAYLGLDELRVNEQVEETAPRGRITGRTRTGARWWVDVPGVTEPARPRKRRISPRRRRRLPVGSAPLRPTVVETDHGAPEAIAREQAVRVLNEELDSLLGVPVLGPTKVSAAWDQGFQAVEQYRQASYETLAALPGFGRSVAELVLVRLGRPPPPHAARRRSLPRPRVGPSGGPGSFAAIEPARPRDPLVLPPGLPPVPEAGADAGAVEETSAGTPSREDSSASESERDSALPGRTSPPEPPAAPPSVSAEPLNDTSSQVAEGEWPHGHGNGAASTGRFPAEGGAIPDPDEVGLPEDPGTPAPPSPTPDDPAGSKPSGSRETESEGWAADLPLPPPGPFANRPEESEPRDPSEPSAPRGTPPAAVVASEFPDWGSVAPDPARGPPLEETPSLALAPGAPNAEGPEAPETEDRTAEVGARAVEPVPGVASATPEDATTRLAREGEAMPHPSGRSVPEEALETRPFDPPPLEPDALDDPKTPEASPGERVGTHETTDRANSPSAPAAEPILEADGTALGSDGDERSPPGTEDGPEPSEEAVLPERVDPTDPHGRPQGSLVEPGLAVELDGLGGVTNAAAAAEETAAPPALDAEANVAPRAGVVLVLGGSILTSLQPFLDATAAGLPGLCLVRESPERVAARVGRRPVTIVWMTNFGRGRTVRPTDLTGIFGELERELLEGGRAAFFVEGLEYLVRIHGVEAVADRLADFERLALDHDIRAWVHLSPDLLRPAEVERLLGRFRSAGPGP